MGKAREACSASSASHQSASARECALLSDSRVYGNDADALVSAFDLMVA